MQSRGEKQLATTLGTEQGGLTVWRGKSACEGTPRDQKLGGRSCCQSVLGTQNSTETQLQKGCHPSPPPALPTAATGPVPSNLSAALAYGRVKVNIAANWKCGFLSETAHYNFVVETHLIPRSGHLKQTYYPKRANKLERSNLEDSWRHRDIVLCFCLLDCNSEFPIVYTSVSAKAAG